MKDDYSTWQFFKIAIKRTHPLEWFSYQYWDYLRENGNFSDDGYCSEIHRILCRAAGHPEGVWCFNVGGSEPNMCCKSCGDDLG